VLLKCDFAIYFNWTAVCISAHIARVMQEIFIGAKKVAGKNETHFMPSTLFLYVLCFTS